MKTNHEGTRKRKDHRPGYRGPVTGLKDIARKARRAQERRAFQSGGDFLPERYAKAVAYVDLGV